MTRFVATFLVAAAAMSLQAQITSEDDAFFGVDSVTRDAVQQLDFLDVTLSIGRSYNDVSSQFGAGGDFEGWRYATAQEVTNLATLWSGAAMITPPCSECQLY